MPHKLDMEKGTIIITGASGAMGSAAVRAMAAEGCSVIMACRNLEKGETVRRDILRDIPQAKLRLMKVDLASLSSVRSFASEITDLVNGGSIRLTGLFNNAGIINRHFKVTEDGYENTMATNFVGPATLTEMLLPLFEDGSHIVSMISLTCGLTHRLTGDFLVPDPDKFGQLSTYAKTKLALLLYTLDLAQRTEGRFKVNMADPGIVDSNMISMGRWFDPLADIVFRPFCKSPERGAAPAVRAMLSDRTARFFIGSRCRDIPARYLRMDRTAVTELFRTGKN